MLHSLATSSHHQSTICPYMDPASACLHGPRGTVQGRWAGDKFAPVAAWRRPVPSHTSTIDQQWPSAYGGLPTVRAVRRGLAAAQRRSARAGQRDGSGGPRPKEARATGPPQGLFRARCRPPSRHLTSHAPLSLAAARCCTCCWLQKEDRRRTRRGLGRNGRHEHAQKEILFPGRWIRSGAPAWRPATKES